MELHFKTEILADGKIKVFTRDGLPNGFGPAWSLFATYEGIDDPKLAEECGAEVVYQLKQEREELAAEAVDEIFACQCDSNAGYLINQTYGSADIPEGWTPVQACDECKVFADDEDAAKEYAARIGREYRWFPGTRDDEDEEAETYFPGDWAVNIARPA